MKKQIVIARYREDLTWVLDHNLSSFCLIYNKGLPLDSPKFNCKTLPNVGRESHTYLTHIIQNYTNLSDITYFIQGNPFDHSSKFVEYFLTAPVDDFIGFSDHPHPIYKSLLYDETVYDESLPRVAKDLDLLSDLPDEYLFSAGAQFAVRKQNILNKPLDFYKKAIKHVDSDINPKAAHSFERLWQHIFLKEIHD